MIGFTRIPRGLVVENDLKKADRAIGVMRRLRTDMVDVELRTAYEHGAEWDAFDLVFLGGNCISYWVLKEHPPASVPPEIYVYDTPSNREVRLLREMYPDIKVIGSTYASLLKLLH